jgi:hypothetical protein
MPKGLSQAHPAQGPSTKLVKEERLNELPKRGLHSCLASMQVPKFSSDDMGHSRRWEIFLNGKIY